MSTLFNAIKQRIYVKLHPEHNSDNYILNKIAYEYTQRSRHSAGSIGCCIIRPYFDGELLPECTTLPRGFILQRIRHLVRYKFISLMVYNKTVLDCACGCGYGSYIMGEHAKSVVGVDLDESAIEEATIIHYGDKFKYYNTSLEEYVSTHDKVDVAVSVETVEHIPPHMIDAFITSLRKSIVDDGLLIITTPIVDETKTYDSIENSHAHCREYSKEDFVNLIERNGLKIDQYLLQNHAGDIIYNVPKKLKFKHATKLNSYVQIAICSKLTGQ